VRIPLSWLAEVVELPESTTVDDVHHALVSVGLEEEDVHRFDVSGPIVVGEVVEFDDEPQSNGKTIRWCQVRVQPGNSDSGSGIRGIVCGASNFLVGDKVVVTLPGAVLPGGFEIAARKTYGHVSDGMIASAKELGLGDDHAGILRLATLGLDPEVGEDAISLLGLDDVAVEVNVTPDRGYAMSMRGIGREYHHATGAAFTDPAGAVTIGEATGFPVALADDSPIRQTPGCGSFIIRVVRGIDATAPTPAFMVSRLVLAGMRPISLAVDITNYVMLELGQPIHGYDLDKLTGGITVRRASPGEKLTTLDDQERVLHPEDLLITDESGPIGLAGVMGGATTEISDSTTAVAIEAAWFDPVSIARTARRHKLPSEAQKRFQRGVDPEVAAAAAQRVADLLVTYGGGTIDPLGAVVEVPGWRTETEIVFHADQVKNLVGIDATWDDTSRILTDIGCQVVSGSADEGFIIRPPSWRPDLVDQATLVEEVARIIGYDAIPSALPIAPAGRGLTERQKTKRRIVTGLASAGMTEVLSYPFVTPESNRAWPVDGEAQDGIRLHNALDDQVSRLRVSLIPGLIDVARRNRSRGLWDLALLEAGSVFVPQDNLGTTDIPPGALRPLASVIDSLNDSIPHQPWQVAGLFTGQAAPGGVGVANRPFDVSDAVDAARLVVSFAGGTLEVEQGSHPSLHPGRTAWLVVNGQRVGIAGELLPSVAKKSDLPRQVAVFEINGDLLVDVLGHTPAIAEALSVFPAATQDISLVVDRGVAASELRQALIEGAGPLLEDVTLVDVYRGETLGDNEQSVTFALRFRAPDRTLTQEEATASKEAGLARAHERTGATLRG